jgi:Putative restriction endonuclease
MTTSTTASATPRELGLDDVRLELFDASDRIERTEQGWVEKRRAYAARGIPHYWIVEPNGRRVTWLVLDPASGAYEGRWEGPLGETPSPWASEGGAGSHGGA